METETNDILAGGTGTQAPERFGPYTLYSEIGRGGMASVHLGKLQSPSGFSRIVAVKRMHADLARSPEFVEMFFEEARLVARIQHPNVVAALDCLALDDTVLLVMEYVHGVSLDYVARTMLARGERVPPSIAATMIIGAALGLDAAHRAVDENGKSLEIVHRDVSPHNVLVGQDGLARVLDFGIAKAAERGQHTRTGEVKGKIGYMAPEQLLGGEIGPEADVYSLGVVLWELLTGRRLFGTDGNGPMLMKIANNQLDWPSQVNPSITPPVEAVVMKALARAPASRYRTAFEFACAIEECLPQAGQRAVGQWVAKVGTEELAHRSAIRSSMDLSMPSRIRSAKELMGSRGHTADGRPDAAPPPSSRARSLRRFGHAGVFLAGVGAAALAMSILGHRSRATGVDVSARAMGSGNDVADVSRAASAASAVDLSPGVGTGGPRPLDGVAPRSDGVTAAVAPEAPRAPPAPVASEASSRRASAASASAHEAAHVATRAPVDSAKNVAPGTPGAASSAAPSKVLSLNAIGGRE